jgi:hypothetical protein
VLNLVGQMVFVFEDVLIFLFQIHVLLIDVQVTVNVIQPKQQLLILLLLLNDVVLIVVLQTVGVFNVAAIFLFQIHVLLIDAQAIVSAQLVVLSIVVLMLVVQMVFALRDVVI